jgi:hypothetical protein
VEKKLVATTIFEIDKKKHELFTTELEWRTYKMDFFMTMLREVRCIRDLRSVSLAGVVDLAAPQIASSLLFPNIVFFLPSSISTFLSSQQTRKVPSETEISINGVQNELILLTGIILIATLPGSFSPSQLFLFAREHRDTSAACLQATHYFS